jgi:spore coat polysaccharide biosynthesis protein SpsF
MKTLCIIQARMASSRLPNKVLADLGGSLVLDLLLERIRNSKEISKIIVATSTATSDDGLSNHLISIGQEVFRGSELDVLKRFADAVESEPNTDIVVRLTADCPFIDPTIIDSLVTKLKHGNFDYCSNRLPPPYKRTSPVGLDVEVFTASALAKANSAALLEYEREHVTPHIFDPMNGFNVFVSDLEVDMSDVRLTIDDFEDLEFCRRVYKEMDSNTQPWQQIVSISKNVAKGLIRNRQKSFFEIDTRWKKDS